MKQQNSCSETVTQATRFDVLHDGNFIYIHTIYIAKVYDDQSLPLKSMIELHANEGSLKNEIQNDYFLVQLTCSRTILIVADANVISDTEIIR